MTNEVAIKKLSRIVDNEAYADTFQDVCRMAISALEKQMPKKPISTPAQHKHFCPACHQPIKLGRQYCGSCGQKIGYGSDTE